MRALFAATLVALAIASPWTPAGAADAPWRHATSLIGKPKYPDGFKQYDYVNPDAPKGGTLNQAAVGTFDSLNPYIVQGTPAAGLSQTSGGKLYDSLMDSATDQAGTGYPLIAEALSYPDDYSWVKFRLNPAARWHDGQPITVDDVIWTFNTLKAQSPFHNKYYANVLKAEATGEREVTFTFDKAGNRELPNIMGELVVLPRHWWEGTDASGKKRDITKTTLEIPLGSGPYKIETVSPGRQIVWSRVPDYWAKDLPTQVGRNNFDRLKIDYYRDPSASWEAFKKGGLDDYRLENRIGRWMTEYDFAAVKSGNVIQHSFPFASSGRMQGYVLNQRRDKFKDPRVREALNYVFDFETMNRTLFFNKYKRIESYFAGIDLASSGLPQGKELEILNSVKDEVPPEVFTKEFKLPVNDTPQALRDNFRFALQLLQEAGWVLKGNQLVNAKNGEPFTIEFLEADPSFERVVSPYIANLKRIGINASLRVVDTAQYVARLNDFDFDVVSTVIAQSQSPGNEQREMWSSAAADLKGSRNLMGIKNPAIDKLIDRVVFATDRDDLVAATHALDRVLLWNYYVVPQWYSDTINVAYWNKFGIPDKQPIYAGIDVDSWWIDPAKEKALGAKP
ncbi:extracellular solute-binding protein [Kaistia dalseonensis]|uniref:Microcin C transport system substrate-binding protein n=1 Tax=Kaistia dalseonensis TaxID=410840 RepID=A0ABU0H9E8_9HYPH|nr:extracellular solute-binding protein [Kaistia dalseonensis]MCX5496329.1 extracellular solute-binding protein [Kaistia dalseonensis]MDQ0438948.1 microcin C transport system substrate-binding protein [Kaistia dalseonensis]